MNLTDSSVLIGAAGEHYVLAELIKRGMLAAKVPEGAPNMDVVVTDLGGERLAALQVKTRRAIGSDNGWHMKAKHDTMFSDRMFYVFVDVGCKPDDAVQFFVVPSAVVAKATRLSHAIWLRSPGKKGQAHNDSAMRRIKPAYTTQPIDDEAIQFGIEYGDGWMEKYRNAWWLLNQSAI